MPELECVELTPERLDDYLHFFEHRALTDNPGWADCYCYFPLHDPAKTDWRATTGPENRQAVCRATAEGRAHGILAYQGGSVVGWCNAGPWSQFPMLADDAPSDSETVGVIFCFLVAPDCRGCGIATAMLDAACQAFRRHGLLAAVARPTAGASTAAENHLGPLSMYLKAGFEVERETPEGGVFVRKALE